MGSLYAFNPKILWLNRDRLLWAGSMLQYALLYLTGYEDLTLDDDLKQFRQWGQNPGHPENFMNPGVEITTGLWVKALQWRRNCNG